MRARATTLLPILLAVIVPLAGLMLTLYELQQGRRDDAVRIGVATLLGACLYTILFTR